MSTHPRLGTAAAYILLSLSKEEQHGYTIMKDTERLSEGAVVLGPATLYTTIRRLVDQGLIVESDDRPDPELDDQRRRYYRLTGAGRKVLDAEMGRMEAMLRAFANKLA